MPPLAGRNTKVRPADVAGRRCLSRESKAWSVEVLFDVIHSLNWEHDTIYYNIIDITSTYYIILYTFLLFRVIRCVIIRLPIPKFFSTDASVTGSKRKSSTTISAADWPEPFISLSVFTGRKHTGKNQTILKDIEIPNEKPTADISKVSTPFTSPCFTSFWTWLIWFSGLHFTQATALTTYCACSGLDFVSRNFKTIRRCIHEDN